MEVVSKPRVLILGGGISGLSVMQVCISRGWEVHLVDRKPLAALLQSSSATDVKFSDCRAELESAFSSGRACFWHENDSQDQVMALLDAQHYSEVVVSPGVSWNSSIALRCREFGVAITGELEWGLRQLSGRIILVTGSNGKTTTAMLINHLLQGLGQRSFLIGNVGTPVTSLLVDNAKVGANDFLVVEASSYQLEASSSFVPEVSLLLNISENHLERHGNLLSYIEAKLKPFRRMSTGARVVTNCALHGLVSDTLKELEPDIRLIDGVSSAGRGALVDQVDQVVIYDGKSTVRLDLSNTPLIGHHNRLNCVAAIMALQFVLPNVCDGAFPVNDIVSLLRNFRMPPYRIQLSHTGKGFTWINDSKSTTPMATEVAIRLVRERYPDKSLVLLCGGEMKMASWDSVWRLIWTELKALNARGLGIKVVFFGASSRALYELFRSFVSELQIGRFEEKIILKLASNLDDAIKKVINSFHADDVEQVVLFSPGCASFDEFSNFQERGAEFDRLVAYD
jgi:UDP-N-acetylmuramoylalanine--D-glutamate ligase